MTRTVEIFERWMSDEVERGEICGDGGQRLASSRCEGEVRGPWKKFEV